MEAAARADPRAAARANHSARYVVTAKICHGGSGHTLEVVLTVGCQGLARPDDEVADGAADEHFTRPRKAADSRPDVDREAADVGIGQQLAFAGVQTRANLQVQLVKIIAYGDRAADGAAKEGKPTRSGKAMARFLSSLGARLVRAAGKGPDGPAGRPC